jgi:hypothetical protein
MGQEAPFRWPVRLRFRRIRDFSDSFSRKLAFGKEVFSAYRNIRRA